MKVYGVLALWDATVVLRRQSATVAPPRRPSVTHDDELRQILGASLLKEKEKFPFW